MRILIITAATLVFLLTSSIAGAYQLTMSLVPGSIDPDGINVGESFSYEIVLDTEGESGITLFSVSIIYDPTIIAYDRANSYLDDYYPLYDPGAGKSPATWLEPINNPPVLWVAPQPGTEQVIIDYIETNLGQTVATATNLKLGEIHFNSVGEGSFALQYGFLDSTSIFSIGGTEVQGIDAFATLTDGSAISVVPEPGMAGLALGALGTVGFLAARRRKA